MRRNDDGDDHAGRARFSTEPNFFKSELHTMIATVTDSHDFSASAGIMIEVTSDDGAGRTPKWGHSNSIEASTPSRASRSAEWYRWTESGYVSTGVNNGHLVFYGMGVRGHW